MANPVFIEDSHLYLRLGGQAALTQLMDPQKTGRWSPAVSLTARSDACNKVLSAAGVAADLGGYSAAEFASKFPNLVTTAALKAIALSWLYASSGQAMPEGIAKIDAEAESDMDKLAERKRKQGAADFNPDAAQLVNGSIDNDPNLDRMTMASWKSGWA